MQQTTNGATPFDHSLNGLLTGPIEVVGCHAEGEVGDVSDDQGSASSATRTRWVSDPILSLGQPSRTSIPSCSPAAIVATWWTDTATGRSRQSSMTSTCAATGPARRDRELGTRLQHRDRRAERKTRSLRPAVHIIGPHRWDRRGAMSTHRYQHLHHHATIGAFAALGLPSSRSRSLPSTTSRGRCRSSARSLPRECVLLFGQEGPGLSAEASAAASMTWRDHTVRVDQITQCRRGVWHCHVRVGTAARAAGP